MRLLFSILLTFSWNAAAEKVCGLFQAEDFGGQKIYSLTDFSTYPTLAIVYRISNVDDSLVRALMGGNCYCLNGTVTESGPDPMFQHLIVMSIGNGPYQGCGPQHQASTAPFIP